MDVYNNCNIVNFELVGPTRTFSAHYLFEEINNKNNNDIN